MTWQIGVNPNGGDMDDQPPQRLPDPPEWQVDEALAWGRLRVGSLFTGGGGLDMAVHALFPDAETAWCSEVDPHASRLLSARMPDVPNLGDITAIDWTQVEPVDVIVGGFPCQDISHAGKRAGITEESRSGLWFKFRDAIRTLRPRLVLVENVAAVTAAGGGLDVVLGSLAEIGFHAEWGCLRAADVGACHGRDRWFGMAWAADTDLEGLEGWHPGIVRERGGQRPAGSSGSPAGLTLLLPTPRASDGPHGGPNQSGDGLQPAVRRLLPTPRSAADRTSRGALTRDGHWSAPALAQAVELASGVLPREYESWDEVQGNQATDWLEYEPAIRQHERIFGRPAPSPADDKGRLSPDFVEWMMIWPEGHLEGAELSRNQRLKILGNGVVPPQAAEAYRQLLERATSPLYAATA